uniref:Uncharacterized protein n=1 Tax=Aegilops tauschii subsp. strangulata TaxID=200361 RepID=A0A453GMZ6_AEGTS
MEEKKKARRTIKWGANEKDVWLGSIAAAE